METPLTAPDGQTPVGCAPVDWRAVGLRRTPQRAVVLSIVRSCYEHPTAEWIHQQARRELPDISLATVYRTLRLLKEKGLIHEFSGGPSPSRFDGILDGPHEHVRCVRCGVVRDVDIPEVGSVRRIVARRSGFQIEKYPLLFHGLCADCGARANVPPSANGRHAPDPRDPERDLAGGFW